MSYSATGRRGCRPLINRPLTWITNPNLVTLRHTVWSNIKCVEKKLSNPFCVSDLQKNLPLMRWLQLGIDCDSNGRRIEDER